MKKLVLNKENLQGMKLTNGMLYDPFQHCGCIKGNILCDLFGLTISKKDSIVLEEAYSYELGQFGQPMSNAWMNQASIRNTHPKFARLLDTYERELMDTEDYLKTKEWKAALWQRFLLELETNAEELGIEFSDDVVTAKELVHA